MKCPDSESLWKDFAAAAGLFGPFLQLRDTFNKWETTDVVPKLKPLYKVVPMFIVWQIWRRRNVIAYGDKMSRRSMKMGINRDLYFMEKSLYPWLINLPTSWVELVFKLNQYSPKIGCKVVYWKHPSEGTFNCNTDGACKGNPGPSSGAYCVRDAAGRFIYAKTKRLGYRTNLIEEIKVFRLGLEYCTSQNLLPLTMETVSLSVKKILDGLWEIPWNVAVDVWKIWRLMEGVPVVVEHVYREGNKLADFLTNEVFSFGDADSIAYANIQELPRNARVILSMDTAQVPNLIKRKLQNGTFN
ncbi:hypothetical protein KY284_012954 [Solanum tuberosum]|nr:hypothetical protein KY284_012954 [Solanum tuberosum]